MMKTYSYIYVLLCCSFLLSGSLYSQVGINTTEPRKDLEVNGDMRITEDLTIKALNPILNGQQSTFLVQDAENKIRSMDVTGNNNAALGYILKYNLRYPNGDWVRNFDTKINANDYSVTIISAFYNRQILMPAGQSYNGFFTIPSYSTFVEGPNGGTWRLEADYPAATSDGGASSWIITVLIYSRDLAKTLPNQIVNMGGFNSRTANNPVID